MRLLARADAREAIESWLAAHPTLAAAARAHPAATTLRGRGLVHVVPAPAGPWPAGTRWAVRHYHRGGAVARALGDRYLRGGLPRPIREYHLSTALERLGIPTPRAIAAAVYPAGAFYRGDLVTEWVPDSRDLAAILFGDARSDLEPAAAMEAAGRLVRRLHECGVVHPDLNIRNILIVPGPAPGALVLDLDRGRIREGGLTERARRRMLERFERSLRKWEGRSGPAPTGARAAFDRGYAASAR